MNTFNFAAGGSRDTRNGKILERELSPGAVFDRRGSGSPSLVDDDVVSPSRTSIKRSNSRASDSESEEERGRHRSGTSAYSDAARKRASGYVARRSSSTTSSSSMKRETSYGSAQIAHFKAAYPRQIDTRNSNVSDSSVQSPMSSVGSSVQRNGSSIFDRSSSRWDSTATDVTTPDVYDRHSKSSLFGKEGREPTFDHSSEAQHSSAIEEEPEELTLLIPNAETASIASTEAIHTTTPEKRPSPTRQIKYAPEMSPAPFVPSDLQSHQCRVQDFSAGTHEVRNSMDMAMDPVSLSPRMPRKSIFVEWENGFFKPVSDERKEALLATESEAEGWEDTLRGLSISAVNGNTEFYTKNDSVAGTPSPGLASVAEEEAGSSWAFGHKRSFGHGESEACGELPLYGQTNGNGEEKADFKPGHRRSRAVSLGRPKTIYVMPEVEQRMSESYEQEDLELDEAVAEDCRNSREGSSADLLNAGEGLERIEEDVCIDNAA